MFSFPVIDPIETGSNIRRLRMERGMTVRDLQDFFGFEEPRAIYKWQKGETLPSVDNLYALGRLLQVAIEDILVPVKPKINNKSERQDQSCRSGFVWGFRPFRMRRKRGRAPIYFSAFPFLLRCP